MGLQRPRLQALAFALAAVSCGGSVVQTVPLRFDQSEPVEIDGLTPCTSRSMEVADLDPNRPIMVLVHGCNDSAARFATLAEVFAAHDQQAVCFTYESRDTIEMGARRLVRSLAELEARAPGQRITVIGHSQGGLVSRRSLTEELAENASLRGDYDLVTVSSPFNGIYVARHCSLNWLHAISFGLTVGICRGIAGRNWHEIHRNAPIVEDPGELRPQVSRYLQVRTDERDSCRERADDGSCKEDDFVFSLAEQRNTKTQSADFRAREVAAGHRQIVGEGGAVPTQLISVLQDEKVMNSTPPEQQEAMAEWLRRVYAEREESLGDPVPELVALEAAAAAQKDERQ